jgi:pimeloyl-ACP methyl ester carboxylesterase
MTVKYSETTPEKLSVAGVDLHVDGQGADTIVMVHGWPDTYRLWDAQAASFRSHYRCVRFTLPGFEIGAPRRALSLDQVIDVLRQVVEYADQGRPVILLLHDWGCFFGYQYLLRHPTNVARLIGVDIGDAGSRRNLAELSFKAKLTVVAYQWWLALAWRLGGRLGDRMARWMAELARAPAPPQHIGAQMGYPYAVRWFGVKGGFATLRASDTQVPMLFFYGERKPFMFHSTAWRDRLAAQPGNRVIGLPTGHWVMVQRPKEFNEAVLSWLAETDEHRA